MGRNLNMQNKQTTENKEAKKNIFQKAGKALAKDLWIVILDILAVNLAYFLALMLRFFVNGQFRPTVSYYQTAFLKFSKGWTVTVSTFMIM